jgi:hypothetical protein
VFHCFHCRILPLVFSFFAFENPTATRTIWQINSVFSRTYHANFDIRVNGSVKWISLVLNHLESHEKNSRNDGWKDETKPSEPRDGKRQRYF